MTSRSVDPVPPIAWWRVPQMWLVVGGPAVVVVAAIVTAVIAVKYQDPVLSRTESGLAAKSVGGTDAKARDEALFNLLPANQGRNHATTLTAPPEK